MLDDWVCVVWVTRTVEATGALRGNMPFDTMLRVLRVPGRVATN